MELNTLSSIAGFPLGFFDDASNGFSRKNDENIYFFEYSWCVHGITP